MSYFTLTIPKTTALFGNCFSISLNWIILSYLIIFCVGLGRTVRNSIFRLTSCPFNISLTLTEKKKGMGEVEYWMLLRFISSKNDCEHDEVYNWKVWVTYQFFFLSPDRTQYRRILVRAQVIVEFNTVVASSLAKDNGCNMAFYIEQDWDRKTIIRKV